MPYLELNKLVLKLFLPGFSKSTLKGSTSSCLAHSITPILAFFSSENDLKYGNNISVQRYQAPTYFSELTCHAGQVVKDFF